PAALSGKHDVAAGEYGQVLERAKIDAHVHAPIARFLQSRLDVLATQMCVIGPAHQPGEVTIKGVEPLQSLLRRKTKKRAHVGVRIEWIVGLIQLFESAREAEMGCGSKLTAESAELVSVLGIDRIIRTKPLHEFVAAERDEMLTAPDIGHGLATPV